ncbi:hypothetical protein L1987_53258 [Smallanthus sonchifolius]|uniref:Uncharacterized protein n=1 Tax=Smallanthus sonchifolius TaxID=185202 RepID=A0ACB9EVE6_9ASTR|nr:hypothetical protein L1987_53258 [Smallanthus sonchifolius]
MVKSRFVTKPSTEKWNKRSMVPCLSTLGNAQSGTKENQRDLFLIVEEWILMRAPRTNNTYQIDMTVATTTSSIATCLISKATEIYSILVHRKLGHLSYRKMNHLVQNGLVTGVPKLRFFVVDDCTKDEIAEILQYLHMNLESLCKLMVRRIRSDNDTEFKNNMMEIFCLKKGIHQEFSAPYTPQQNGVAERKNRTLIDTTRTMLSDAKLLITFWAEAVNTACHVLNRVLVEKRHNKTSYELINNRPPKLGYLIPFGSPCSLLLQHKDRQSKFHAKAVEGIFLGYVANSPCKRVYNIKSRTTEEWFEVDCSTHNTTPEPTGPAWGVDYDSLFKSFNLPDLFAEDAANLSNVASASGTHESDTEEDTYSEEDGAQIDQRTHVRYEAPVDPINIESSSGVNDMCELSTNLETYVQETIVLETIIHRNHPIDNVIGDPNAGVQTRQITVTENTSLYAEILNTGIMETCLKAAFVSQIEPKNIKEALPDNCWIEAMQDELSQFRKLHVWDLVDLPRGVHPIETRWVFKCKTDDRHVVVKNKARLVVQGFYQQEGLDYMEVYAPVSRLESIRLFLAYASFVGVTPPNSTNGVLPFGA